MLDASGSFPPFAVMFPIPIIVWVVIQMLPPLPPPPERLLSFGLSCPFASIVPVTFRVLVMLSLIAPPPFPPSPLSSELQVEKTPAAPPLPMVVGWVMLPYVFPPPSVLVCPSPPIPPCPAPPPPEVTQGVVPFPGPLPLSSMVPAEYPL